MLHETKTVEVCQVHKSFGGKEVVDDISFEVKSGEVFGMIGPNGAGKTTTIRMMMDIIKPDSGEVHILGDHMRESTKDRIGYLPEERGLYRKITVAESLEYLAQLKGLAPSAAKSGADNLLHRVGMFQHTQYHHSNLGIGTKSVHLGGFNCPRDMVSGQGLQDISADVRQETGTQGDRPVCEGRITDATSWG